MRLVFTESGWKDYLWFQEKDLQLLRRINQLIRVALRTPYEVPGKPERLKADLSGYRSQRINDEHRLVYSVSGQDLVVISCRYHYAK